MLGHLFPHKHLLYKSVCFAYIRKITLRSLHPQHTRESSQTLIQAYMPLLRTSKQEPVAVLWCAVMMLCGLTQFVCVWYINEILHTSK